MPPATAMDDQSDVNVMSGHQRTDSEVLGSGSSAAAAPVSLSSASTPIPGPAPRRSPGASFPSLLAETEAPAGASASSLLNPAPRDDDWAVLLPAAIIVGGILLCLWLLAREALTG